MGHGTHQVEVFRGQNGDRKGPEIEKLRKRGPKGTKRRQKVARVKECRSLLSEKGANRERKGSQNVGQKGPRVEKSILENHGFA